MTPRPVGSLAGLRSYPVKSLAGIDHQQATLTRLGLDGDRRWAVIGADGEVLTQREVPLMATIAVRPRADGLELRRGDAHLTVILPAQKERIRATVWRAPVDAVVTGGEADRFVSDQLGVPCRLVHLDPADARALDPAFAESDDRTAFADGFPLLVTTTGSLAALNARLAEAGLDPVPMDRFRTNLLIDHDEAWAEHRWRRLCIGAAGLRLVKPCERCQIPTIDQRTGTVDPRSPASRGLLRALVGVAGIPGRAVFGMNAIPEAGCCPAELRVGDLVTVCD